MITLDSEPKGRRLTGDPERTGLSSTVLLERALQHGEGSLTRDGALAVHTGRFTGRSPGDRFLVRAGAATEQIAWGPVNQPLGREAFERLRSDMLEHAVDLGVYTHDLWAGRDPNHALAVRIVTERAWHGLFARHLFVDERPEGASEEGGWTVIDLPSFRADPRRHETASPTAIAVDLEAREVLIANTEYGGEIKKSIFTVLNYRLPARGVLPMHCSANIGADGRVALFFGLSGTGKTTLSSSPDRMLIGDDEHGWSDRGVFNFEGGCYAKAIGLDAQREPEIYAAARRFGTVLENVVLEPASREPRFEDGSLTENTRAAYPLEAIPSASASGRAGHPSAVVFLTADAFGVLPPIARLSPEQAMYHFLSGYTAKVAGTERGVTEPQATFSACFGAPFMPLPAATYATMLGERLRAHGASVWLVNTGWTGGAYGTGRRMSLATTRRMVAAAVAGELDAVASRPHPIFGVHVPEAVAGVPAELLDPRATWPDAADYDRQAARLAAMFAANAVACDVPDEIRAAGPTTG